MALGGRAGVSGVSAVWSQVRPPLLLRWLSHLYALGWRAYEGVYRLGLKRRQVLPVPIIGVGSLWVGGVSKTPLTIAIARYFHQQERRVVALAHGYGGRCYRQITLLEPGEVADPYEVGDEACEIRWALPEVPLAVGKWRVPVARAAIHRWQPDLMVMDDGFQHLPLARRVDLVLLPAEAPFGNGYCLPAGPLREPPSGLRRASAVLWIGEGEAKAELPLPTFRVVLRTAEPVPLRHNLPPLDPQTPVHIITGIARPERFIEALRQKGWRIESIAAFPDHADFRHADMSRYRDAVVLTTVKDGVKLSTALPPSCHAYALPLLAEPEVGFWEWLAGAAL